MVRKEIIQLNKKSQAKLGEQNLFLYTWQRLIGAAISSRFLLQDSLNIFA